MLLLIMKMPLQILTSAVTIHKIALDLPYLTRLIISKKLIKRKKKLKSEHKELKI